MAKRRVAILGGTFNPVHRGHVVMAEQALQQFDLDQILWIPAGDPPHKPLAPGSSTQDRLAMVQLAIAPYPRFAWSDLEIRRQGRSYAVQTVETLQQLFPDTEWYWVIGADALRDLAKWYEIDRLLTLCWWIVAPRPDLASPEEMIPDLRQQLGDPFRALILESIPWDVSSTQVREKVQLGESIQDLVPEAVATYIQKHRLYLPQSLAKIEKN